VVGIQTEPVQQNLIRPEKDVDNPIFSGQLSLRASA